LEIRRAGEQHVEVWRRVQGNEPHSGLKPQLRRQRRT
jgi:hypothetical protein